MGHTFSETMTLFLYVCMFYLPWKPPGQQGALCSLIHLLFGLNDSFVNPLCPVTDAVSVTFHPAACSRLQEVLPFSAEGRPSERF